MVKFFSLRSFLIQFMYSLSSSDWTIMSKSKKTKNSLEQTQSYYLKFFFCYRIRKVGEFGDILYEYNGKESIAHQRA